MGQSQPGFAKDAECEVNKLFGGLNKLHKKKNKLPLTKQINKFKEIMSNPKLCPLEKLYKLQYLDIEAYMESN